MAYVLLLAFSLVRCRRHPFLWFSRGWRDELLMAALGVTGGSLYFLTENMALSYTTATNTSLIVCSCPLFAMLLVAAFYRTERLGPWQAGGSLVALAGMAVVVLNGHFVLHLSPVGDALAFAACLCWAVYSLLMKPAMGRYPSLFITRKMFFYGVLTILPYYIYEPGLPPAEVLLRTDVAANLLFLGCVASMVCFLTWNWAMKKLGAVSCTNWVYLNPVATIVAARLVLGEQITPYFLMGSALILLGLWLSNRRLSRA